MKRAFTYVGKAETFSEASMLAEKLYDDPRFIDKWGPAGCIEVTKPLHPEQGRYFLFFGWASA